MGVKSTAVITAAMISMTVSMITSLTSELAAISQIQ